MDRSGSVSRIALLIATAACGLLVSPCRLDAQRPVPLAVDLRLGVTRPVPCVVWCEGGDPGEGTAGWWNGSIAVNVHRDMSVFAGYSRYELQKSRDQTDTGSGIDVGARLDPWAHRTVSPWVRAGVLLHRRRFRFPAAAQETGEVLSDRGWGWLLGAGLAFRLTSFLAITPGVHYQRYTTNVNFDEAFQRPMGGERPYRTSYFIFDLGLRLNR